jgi:DNA-binding CsgD family transcriptional regulator
MILPEQAAVILLDANYKPLYVSTEAARILLPSATANMATAAEAMVSVVQRLIADANTQGEGKRFGFLGSETRPYLWNITRCDEWTSSTTPWNYVMMIRNADVPENKIKAVTQQFQLSKRQEETLSYLFQGLTSKEIAKFLDLSPNTVKIHIRALMTKLQCTTRTALVGRVLAASTDD